MLLVYLLERKLSYCFRASDEAWLTSLGPSPWAGQESSTQSDSLHFKRIRPAAGVHVRYIMIFGKLFRQCSRRGSQTFPWIQCPNKEVPLNVTLWNAIAAVISTMKPVLGRLCSRHINFCPWWSFVVVTFSKGTHTVQVALFLTPRIPLPLVNLVLHDQLNFFSMVSISILTVSV